MKEHYINVAVDGKHLFRTDWDDDLERVRRAVTTLRAALPQAKISVSSRDKVMELRTANEFLGDVS